MKENGSGVSHKMKNKKSKMINTIDQVVKKKTALEKMTSKTT